MVRLRQRRKPSFFWQPLVILCPVIILAVLGFLSLRQDKVIAQHDAAERAQAIADSLLPSVWLAITNADNPEAFEHQAFQIDNGGELLIPQPLPLTPSTAPMNLRELTSQQAVLWQHAQFAEANNDIPGSIQAIRDFLNTEPPERFAAVADYDLSAFLIKKAELQNAANVCLSLLDKHPNEISEGGLPLSQLSAFELLGLSIMMTNPRPEKVLISADDFCRAIVFDPSPLTAPFLSWVSAHAEALGLKNGNDYWNRVWREHEASRQFYKSARPQLMADAVNPSQIFWFNNDGENCLAIRFDELPEPTGSTVLSSRLRWRGSKGKMDLRPEPGKNYLASPNPNHNEPAGFSAQPSGKSHYDGGTPQRNIVSPEFSNPELPVKSPAFLPRPEGTPENSPGFQAWEGVPQETTSPEGTAEKSRNHQTETGKVTLYNEPARIEPSRPAKVIINRSRGTAERSGMTPPDFLVGPAINSPTAATNLWFLCRTESEIGHNLFSLLETNGQLPEYFGIAIEVAGKRLREAAPDLHLWRKVGFFEGGGKGRKINLSTTATNVLASASHSDNGVELLKIDVYLTSPATLFQRQSDRTFWFGSLVAVSAVAAFAGLFSAWRAFNRQQELTEMKSNFVSSVSHELRAPIASVRLMAESLERGKVADPPKQHEYFRFIGQECRRLSSLIENVLDFSRIEQGRKQYEFEPTDLLALVQQTVKLMEAYAVERQISVSLDLPNHQLSTFNYQLSLDGRAIQQALINLLDNAIKHSPNGQTVTVALEFTDSGHASRITHHSPRITHHALAAPKSDEGGSRVLLSVLDHGPGIPPEEHQKIFERFYRLGSELRRETQGVGIGLSIVKHIVEAHHGRILVQSAPGHGSKFTIALPIADTQLISRNES